MTTQTREPAYITHPRGSRVHHRLTNRTGTVISHREFDNFLMISWENPAQNDKYCTAYSPSEFEIIRKGGQ
ncbi:hypothetical protein [Deinococcus fonticola]|uniref:hypothetical protein n=1 Tax=Deinococcus fonticola TaxID=2528713 RepID=UPI001075292A|nr:hypothetical protein [Deinococcus fonticola]